MKKVRFFNSIFLEALDQRTTSILESHKELVKQTNNELQSQQLKLDKRINDELNLLLTSKDSAIIEYRLRQLYVVEKYIIKRISFITLKSKLTTLISIFEEILIELRTILVNELHLLDQEALKITTSHHIHNTIIKNIPIYSKTINSSWSQIKEAIDIESNLNKDIEKLTEGEKETLFKIKSIKKEKLQSEVQIMALADSRYHQDLMKAIEVYFIEMNDMINKTIKKTV